MGARRSSAEIAAELQAKYSAKNVPAPEANLWKIRAVVNFTGRSRGSILRDVAKGIFPKPIRLGENSVAWLRVEVEKWLADRIAERR